MVQLVQALARPGKDIGGEGGGEPHPVRDGAVPVEPHHLVLLRDVVQETGKLQVKSISSRPLTGLLTPPFLIIGKERVRHPDFLRKITRKSQNFVLLR